MDPFNLKFTDPKFTDVFEKLYREDSSEAILVRVRKVEQIWRVSKISLTLLTCFGASLFSVTRNQSMGHFGLFCALSGLIGICTVSLRTQMSLTLLWTVWSSLRRREDELRRSIAEDL